MKKFFIIIILFLVSCETPQIPQEVLKAIEYEDDNLCNLEGLNYESKYYPEAEETRDVYWRCRLRIINQRINGEFDTYGYSQLYKNEFKKIRNVIKNRLRDEQEKLVNEIFNTYDDQEHNFCVALKDQTHLHPENPYTYFDCVEDLKRLRELENGDFSMNTNENTLNKLIGYEEDKDESKSIKNIERECVKYATDDEKLSKCEKALVKIRECESNIFFKLMTRRIDDKIFCSKQSVEKYPDSLAKFDYYSTELSGPKMDKGDLVTLRDKEYKTCYDNRVLKIPDYRDYLINECKKKNLDIIEKELE